MDNLAYRPFGGATAMDNGAGGIVGSVYNLGGKLTVSNPGAVHEMTYGYDNNGNLTSVDAPSTPWYNRVNETPTTYTYYPGTNRLYQTITATETKNYFYDANGNITDIGNRVLTYNQGNRLIRVEEDSVTLGEYNYNGIGQRIIKQAGGVTTVFHYDFDGNIIGESDTSGVFSKEYLYRGSNRLVLVDVGTGELYYYGNDQLGTPQILTDSTNTVVWEAVYKPYGEADVNPNSTVVNNFRLPGQYYDEETGLHYNYNRYYDPRIGRYLTPDPIGLAGGINLYAYVSNNPVNLIDPFGLYAWYDEFNVFDRNSAMSKQSIGMWNGVKGSYYSLMGNTQAAREAFKIAGANSGQSLLEEANASCSAYAAYYGSLGLAGAGVSGVVVLGSIETLAAAGYYKVGVMVTQRYMALMAFGSSAGGRYFSPGQAQLLIRSGARATAWYGRNLSQKAYNFLTTIPYGGKGQGEVTLNWVTRKIIHSNPFK